MSYLFELFLLHEQLKHWFPSTKLWFKINDTVHVIVHIDFQQVETLNVWRLQFWFRRQQSIA